MPITKKAEIRSTEKSIEISSLDEFAQRAFKNYKHLNRVQSIVFPIVYKTNENLLICAPTGAVRISF